MRWASIRRSSSGIMAGYPTPATLHRKLSQLTTSPGRRGQCPHVGASANLVRRRRRVDAGERIVRADRACKGGRMTTRDSDRPTAVVLQRISLNDSADDDAFERVMLEEVFPSANTASDGEEPDTHV